MVTLGASHVPVTIQQITNIETCTCEPQPVWSVPRTTVASQNRAGTRRDGVRLSAWLPRCEVPRLEKTRPGPKVPRLKRGMPIGGTWEGFLMVSPPKRVPLNDTHCGPFVPKRPRRPLRFTDPATPSEIRLAWHFHGTVPQLAAFRAKRPFSTGPNFTIWFEF